MCTAFETLSPAIPGTLFLRILNKLRANLSTGTCRRGTREALLFATFQCATDPRAFDQRQKRTIRTHSLSIVRRTQNICTWEVEITNISNNNNDDDEDAQKQTAQKQKNIKE